MWQHNKEIISSANGSVKKQRAASRQRNRNGSSIVGDRVVAAA